MAKALKKIKEKKTLIDLFIVVLDARAPISSYNSEFDLIAPNKPRLFVVSKLDLADEKKINKIKNNFNNKNDSIIFCNLINNKNRKKIFLEIKKLLKIKRKKELKLGLLKPRFKAMVIGVPNSGKSTLINLLSKSYSTKTGNTPGITKGQQ
jgi:ribosome biogenesis GTPase A